MPPEFRTGNVRSHCPDCDAITTFEYTQGGTEFGTIVTSSPGRNGRLAYKLLRCAGCSRAGVAKVEFTPPNYTHGSMDWFWPSGMVFTKVPRGTPEGVVMEFAEAQICMAASAWRAGAALLRSTLEKTLLANGYKERALFEKIEAAAKDGAITSARRQRAQDLVRTLGNDVLHEAWRSVTQEEAELALHYVGRVVEDFYDDRPTVEKLLREKDRLPPPPPVEASS